MVAHFWIEEYGGMAWSGGTVGAGIITVGVRVAGPLRSARIPAAIRLHIALAFANVTVAAVVGVLLRVNKIHSILPGFVLHNVFAHAQLAAVGWAAMMVVGIGYRLLPMVLPAEMPRRRGLWVSAILLQSGITGVFVTLLLRVGLTWIFASLVVAGFGAFFREVNWMVRHRRPKPPAIPAPDPAVLHAAAALAWLAMACILGLWLARRGAVHVDAARSHRIRRARPRGLPGADDRGNGETAAPAPRLVLRLCA